MKLKIFTLVFFPLLIIYLLTAPQAVYWQDSGIYLAGIKTFGILYPPGYPLYELLGFGWTQLLTYIFGNILPYAYYLHTLSAVFGAGASGFVALSTYNLLKFLSLKSKFLYPKSYLLNLISICIGLSSGLSYSIWAQSINSEVYSLHALFASLIIYLLILITVNHKNSNQRNFYFLILILSLSFANHPSTILFLPAIIYYIAFIKISLISKSHLVKKLIIYMLLFTIPLTFLYLMLIKISLNDPIFQWNRIRSVTDLYAHISGSGYLTSEVSFNFLNYKRLISLPVLLFQELFLSIPLIIYGALHLIKLDKFTKHLTHSLLILVSTIYFVSYFYQQGGEYNYWLIPAYLVFMIFIAIALFIFVTKKNIYLILILTLFIPQLIINLKLNNKPDYYLAQEFGQNILKNLPYGSILFVIGDQDSSITKYLQLVENFRSDILILRPPDFIEKWRLEAYRNQYPKIILPDEYPETIANYDEQNNIINNFIKLNLESHPIFIIQKSIMDLDEDLKLAPAGTLWQIYPEANDPIIDLKYWQYHFSDNDRYQRYEREEAPRKIKNNLGQTIDIVRQRYSDEPKNWELQSHKNFIDYCQTALENRDVAVIKLVDDKIEYWREKRLANCILDEFAKMLGVDPNFYHPDVWQSVSKAYNYIGNNEQSKKYHSEFIIRSTNQK